MRRFTVILGAGLGILLLIFLVLVWRVEHLATPTLDGEQVAIQLDGQVTQSGSLVGVAKKSGERGELLLIPLARPDSGPVVTGSLEITFPKPAEGIIQVTPTSIEGGDVLSASWVNDSLLRITVVEALTEGYPSVILGFPDAYFSLSPVLAFVQASQELSVVVWLIAAALLLVLVFSFAYMKTRPVNFKGPGNSLPHPPGDLRPIELALLHHGSLHPTDLAALFYNLAERGYLEIIDHGDETGEVLFLRSGGDEGLATYEKNFLLLLFTNGIKPVRLSEVLRGLNQELFSAVVSQLYVEVYDSFSARGFFRDSPRAIHLRYKTTGIFLQLVAVLLAFVVLFGLVTSIPALLVVAGALYVAGALTFRIGYRVVPFSRIGWELAGKAADFVRYLRDPEPFVWGVGPDTEVFYSYVPYSLVAQEVSPWHARFSNYKRWSIPDWYTDINEQLVTPEKFVAQVGVVAAVLGEALSDVKDPNVD